MESEIIESDEGSVIVDLDVTSYYPTLAIANGFRPAHLGLAFVDIYQHLFEERKKHPEGLPENAMLKLALNGVYGDSNNVFRCSTTRSSPCQSRSTGNCCCACWPRT